MQSWTTLRSVTTCCRVTIALGAPRPGSLNNLGLISKVRRRCRANFDGSPRRRPNLVRQVDLDRSM